MMDGDDWYGPDAATFGDRVAAARDAANMTQEQLAKRLGVKLKTLQSWEEDLSEPRANRLSMMAGLLNVSMMWLINGQGEGLSGPLEKETASEEVQTILVELRAMQNKFHAAAEDLGRLEKRLRKTMTEGA
ncbi:helix-turn-helix domain-containing protein [Thalassococcus sp. BH17M4-6]|uniref:helix-turn-helix domain-containing protein n=1 Tax=Thalassococcus sp. BH17M4-6 TaxID=3413148 RepID=UPI003BD7B2C3